jgi:hypothetical protein
MRLQGPALAGMPDEGDFDRLVTGAIRAPVYGWDFAWLAEREHGGQPC